MANEVKKGCISRQKSGNAAQPQCQIPNSEFKTLVPRKVCRKSKTAIWRVLVSFEQNERPRPYVIPAKAGIHSANLRN